LAPDDQHECKWRSEAEKLLAEAGTLREEVNELRQKLASLERRLLGPKSEKMPPMAGEVKRARPAPADEAKARRNENKKAREKLPTDTIPVPVQESERVCPSCGDDSPKTVGDGTPSVVYVYVAPHFRRRIYQRETVACQCGSHIVTASCPEKIFDRTAYSASFVAGIIVHKCEDGIPIYRLEKQFERWGIPVARSTMTDLFHRGAELLSPIAKRILARIAESDIVFADETSLKMQSSEKRAFVWTFLDDTFTGFVFNTTRSGSVPVAVLGDSQGELMADLYTGYNAITVPGRRRRAGCLAHARRKIFDAKAGGEAQIGLDLIRDMYVVEHDARASGIEGTDAHLALRASKTRPLMARLLAWSRRERRRHGPKSLLGKAVGYIIRNRKPLTRFLYVAKLPLDNNRSESALRRVALGRKNYLFVGHEEAGENIAGLFTIVASCATNGVNPVDYITDVLQRVSHHPASDIDAILPDRWGSPDLHPEEVSEVQPDPD
jgi:transposase